VSSTGLTRSLLLLAAAGALLAGLAGCGSDDSGDDTTASQVSIPSPTSPIPTTTTPGTATGGGKKQGQTSTTAGGGGGATECAIPDAYQDFKFTGLDCTAAVAVATAWDRNGNECNTVDNPNVDEGYNRTCTVEAFTCTAKRDVKSDARFVSCTQGGQSIRFTWLPA
jgi:hypothetical protein